ncbi:MAG: hypothetical protein JWO56_3615 [Acidobacteria bacterium]|nr:hypothetical protein [Acidobacteriota bacterium]
MIRALAVAPPPLTPAGKRLAIVLTALVAITRWLALSKTLWDWDESLFMLALRHYNVVEHHPHPPGFPLFIATAKLFTLAGVDAFHALQSVNFLASVAIVPVMLFLGRELRAGFRISLVAALFLAFFPNVWFYGGTAFSDVPSMVLVMLAVALLLRGCRDHRSFYLGAAILGIAAGYRPQNLVIGFAPALLAAWFQLRRKWTTPLVAAVIAGALILLSYGAAISLSGGWDEYRGAVRLHQAYITQIDSFRSPLRPPLHKLFDDFFIRPYRAPLINIVVTLLATLSIVSVVRRRLHVWAMLLSFGPFCLLAWLLLDRFSVSRFSIGYAPLLALLAADGLDVLLHRWPRLEYAIAAAVVALMIAWTWPGLRDVHTHASPTFSALAWIRRNVDPKTTTLYVHEGMQPYAEELLPGYSIRYVMDTEAPTTWLTRERSLFVKEGASAAHGARVFTRSRNDLWELVRQRYFEVSIVPMDEIVDFRDGWYTEEGSGEKVWRWMAARGVALLPRLPGPATLTLRLYVPLDALPAPPTVTVRLNGVVLDRFVATAKDIERSYTVTPRADAANELVLETDRIVNPAAEHLRADTRDLGVRLQGLEWRTAGGGR